MIEMMGHRVPARTPAERDVITRWGRKYLCFLQRPGVKADIKRGMRRRERRAGRAEAREESR